MKLKLYVVDEDWVLDLTRKIKMEWKIEIDDLFQFAKSNENRFPIFMKFSQDTDDPFVKSKLAIITLDANSAFQRHIADLGFSSREEIDTESRQQTRSLVSRLEHLYGAANEAKKGRDFVSGLDLGKLQEDLVEMFLLCVDHDWNYVLGEYERIAMFETLLKNLLRDNPGMSWLKWKFHLTGSMAEESQVPDMSYQDGICSVNVNPECDIMLSVPHVTLGLNEQSLTDTQYPGFVYLRVPASPKDDKKHLLQLLTKRDSKYYFSALKFKNGISRMLNELKVTSDQKEKPEKEDFELEIAPHGPAIQIDETYYMEGTYNSYDVVPAIEFSGWPACCQKWVSRKRLWPPQSLVDEIIQDGFHLVAKTSPQGDEDLEWRFSFSKAERKLMKSKGLGNRNYCFRIFKMAIKENISSTCSLLTSYHLKTLLLWASERHPPDKWSDENLAVCFLGLLDDLLHSLANCSCPHYFLPDLNLFLDCSKDHLYHLAGQVSAIRRSPLKYLRRPGDDPKEGYHNFIGAMKEWKEMDYSDVN